MRQESTNPTLATRAAGAVLGAPYAAAMRVRRWAFERGICRSFRAEAPVICVGNITCGGTGKTPMVAWIVRQLQRAGKTPAILTRGYKAVAGRSDEAELLEQLTGAAVIVEPDRVAGARKAVAGGADVLVMDDGFQHLRLRRDLNVVLIDATRPFGGGYCLPVGRLREPLSALRAADAVVVTRSDAAPDIVPQLRRRLRPLCPRASVHLAAHEVKGLVDPTGARKAPDALAGRRVFAFCGIGNPGAFRETLDGLGVELAGLRALGDHVAYTRATLAKIESAASDAGADVLVTTRKDHVKVRRLQPTGTVWQVVVEMVITDGEAELLRKIHAAAGGPICDAERAGLDDLL